MNRTFLLRACALIAIAASSALGQQTGTSPTKKQAKAAARAAETPEVRARRDSMKALSADEKRKKHELKSAKAANDTAKVAQLKAAIDKDKAEHKALKAKVPPKAAKPEKPAKP